MSDPLSAVAALTAQYLDDPAHGAHRVYWGRRKVRGVKIAENCVVVHVPRKMPLSALSDRPIVRAVNGVRVDVQESPRANIEILPVNPDEVHVFALNDHTSCQQPRVPGGAQIQPRGAGWVGTLGCMVMVGGNAAAITNAHVTGLGAARGHVMGQPSGSNPFARVQRVVPIDFSSGAENRVDLGVLNCRNSDGKDLCDPRQIGLGVLGRRASIATVGMRVAKSGRTTFVTNGECVGIHGAALVGYGGGKTARFVDLDVYEADSGDFSRPGDSGSAILRASSHDLVSLLFAGGGGQTLGCASRHVLQAADATMYEGAQ